MNARHENLWTIVLAGGEGERTRRFIELWLGEHKPKQYCAFVGTRSMFQHTVDRADRLVRAGCRLVVTASTHRVWIAEQLSERPRGEVLFQPSNRGTAVGLLLALAWVRARDPEARVIVLPADHFVFPEDAFLRAVSDAVRISRERDGIVLLGVRPDRLECDYGWIQPRRTANAVFRAQPVSRFVEKPDRSSSQKLMRGGALWNTLVLAGSAARLWKLAARYLPELPAAFERHPYGVASAAMASSEALRELYEKLPTRDLSRDLLERTTDSLLVLPMDDVRWSDWGRPKRILKSLQELGARPTFAEGNAFPVEPPLHAGSERVLS